MSAATLARGHSSEALFNNAPCGNTTSKSLPDGQSSRANRNLKSATVSVDSRVKLHARSPPSETNVNMSSSHSTCHTKHFLIGWLATYWNLGWLPSRGGMSHCP